MTVKNGEPSEGLDIYVSLLQFISVCISGKQNGGIIFALLFLKKACANRFSTVWS